MLTPSRRWFRFSLRTLFVTVTAVALGTWLVLNLLQLRARERVMQTVGVSYIWDENKSPLLWSMLGGKYYDRIAFPSTSFSEEDVARMQALFPEAKLMRYDPNQPDVVPLGE